MRGTKDHVEGHRSMALTPKRMAFMVVEMSKSPQETSSELAVDLAVTLGRLRGYGSQRKLIYTCEQWIG